METSRKNAMNGGYKIANTRPISASFSLHFHPSRVMNPSPSTRIFRAAKCRIYLLGRFIFDSVIGLDTWKGRREQQSLMSGPIPGVGPSRGWRNFLTAEKSHPPEGAWIFGNVGSLFERPWTLSGKRN